MTGPPARPPGDDVDEQVSRDFDDVERITAAVTRVAVAAAVVAPLWLLLLWLLGATIGVGLGSLIIATLAAGLAGWAWLRRFGPSRADAVRGRRRAATEGMGIPRIAIIIAVVIIFAYLLLVLKAAG